MGCNGSGRCVGPLESIPVCMTKGGESHMAQALSSGARDYIRRSFAVENIKQQTLPAVEQDT